MLPSGNLRGASCQPVTVTPPVAEWQHRRVAEPPDSTFADRIDQLLKDLGWSQRRLAKEAGLTTAAISRYASGDRETPDVKAMDKIAKATGYSLEWLTFGRGSPRGATSSLPDEIPNGLRAYLESLPPDTFTAAEIAQATQFHSLRGDDLLPEQWERFLRTIRALDKQFDGEVELAAALRPKVDLHVVTDDPIEERKRARAKKRG